VEHLRSIYISTYAILFLETPYGGLTTDYVFLTQQEDGRGPSQFVRNLCWRIGNSEGNRRYVCAVDETVRDL
jgi:hypothetical protein